MTQQILTAVLHKEDDLYVAECPEVGTVSQGYTIEEAVANRGRLNCILRSFLYPKSRDLC